MTAHSKDAQSRGWHPDDSVVHAYAGGTAEFAAAASTEAHLAACAPCRARLRPAVDAGRLDAIWAQVGERLAEQAPRSERFLRRLGVSEPTARLVLATPALRRSWLASLALVVGMLVLVAQRGGTGGLLPFLVLAPLAPVAGVALAYGPAVEPAYEVGIAAPFSSFRLLLLRTCAVLTTTVPVAGLGALALPGTDWLTLGWLLPALGLTSLTLALSSRLDPRSAAGLATGLWAVTIGYARLHDGVAAAFGPTVQAAAAVLAAAGAVAAFGTRHRYGSLGGPT